ncbi:MAG: AAA family ATPase [Candidatus Binatia bacterium]
MYAHFYHLSENPFNLTPDPKFHYINESTREALAAVLYGIKSRKGFLTLIGEAGTGKTTLLRRIVDEIEGETRVVFVFNPGVSFDELLEYLCMELGIRTEGGGRLQLIEKLNQYLLEQLTEGRNVVVIIDEAQTLEDGVLEELRMLSNLETSKEKILQIVLSGQPELEEKLRKPNLRQLRQRIGVRATLKPMRSDEIRAYVETRLKSAGGQKAELFTAPALLRCWKASQGIPRVINVICDNAMMVAFAEGSDRITVSVMNAAIRDLDGLTRSEAWWEKLRESLVTPAVRFGALAAAVLVAAFALGRGMGLNEGEMPKISVPVAAAPGAPAAAPAPARQAPAPSPPPPAVAVATPALAATPPAPPESANSGGLPPAVASATDPVAPTASSASVDPAATGATTPTAAVTPKPVAEFVPPPASALPGSPATSPLGGEAVRGSVRRAEEMARSTAARLYGGTPPPPSVEQDSDLLDLDVPEGVPGIGEGGPMAEEGPEARPARAEPRVIGLDEPETAMVKAPRLPAEAPPSLAAPPSGLADGLETVASLSGGAARLPKSAEKPVIGRHVRVARGDTVWAIAMQYYGSVDSSVLTEIFRHNPGIRNAHQLPVGSDVFVPFLKPEHMVDPVQGGGYRVLVAESPEAGEIAKASNWASSRLPGRELRTTSKGRDNPVRMVYATGFTGREAALAAARQLLGPVAP